MTQIFQLFMQSSVKTDIHELSCAMQVVCTEIVAYRKRQCCHQGCQYCNSLNYSERTILLGGSCYQYPSTAGSNCLKRTQHDRATTTKQIFFVLLHYPITNCSLIQDIDRIADKQLRCSNCCCAQYKTTNQNFALETWNKEGCSKVSTSWQKKKLNSRLMCKQT